MNICVTVNSKYMRYLYVMLQSLYENNERGSIDLYVLQRDFTEYDKKVISDISDRFQNKVYYIFVNEQELNVRTTYIGGRNDLPSEIIYFRLTLPEFLPNTLDRVLLLDVDLVINQSIAELYNIDFEGHILAAAPNMCHNFVIHENWRTWYPKNRKNWVHYNIGVLMWNLKELRKLYPSLYILNQAYMHRIKIETFDEELFNVIFGENMIKQVSSEKWNYIVTQLDVFKSPKFKIYDSIEDMKKHCAIIHYASMNPWAEDAKREKFSLWWEYAKKTPYYSEFLEEELLKNDRYIRKIENALSAERKVISDFNSIYQLKGTGKIGKYIESNNFILYFYGAGMVAELFYSLLIFEGVEKIVKGVFDKNRKGDFHGVPIYNEFKDIFDGSEKKIIIVTPSYDRDEIVRELKKNIGKSTEVVVLPEFLNKILSLQI